MSISKAEKAEQSFVICPLRDKADAIPQLARWQHAEWAQLNPGDTEEKRAGRLRAQIRSGDLPQTWVAAAGSRVLGSASLVPCDMDNHPEWQPWLASVFVAPQQRRMGVGTSLVRHVEREALRRGFSVLYLFTVDRPGFYERFGWERLGDEVYRGEKVTVMRRDLRTDEDGR